MFAELQIMFVVEPKNKHSNPRYYFFFFVYQTDLDARACILPRFCAFLFFDFPEVWIFVSGVEYVHNLAESRGAADDEWKHRERYKCNQLPEHSRAATWALDKSEQEAFPSGKNMDGNHHQDHRINYFVQTINNFAGWSQVKSSTKL